MPSASADALVNAIEKSTEDNMYRVVSEYLSHSRHVSSVVFLSICVVALICCVFIVFVLGDNRIKNSKESLIPDEDSKSA